MPAPPWRRTTRSICGATASLLLLGTSLGQEAEIGSLRKEFEAQLTQTAGAQERRYVEELEKRERILADQGNYAAAIALRDERLKVEARIAFVDGTLSPNGTGTPDSPSSGRAGSVYAATTANKGGGARSSALDPAAATLSSVGDELLWTLPDLPPGGYEVLINYACDSSLGGTFQVQEEFFVLTAPFYTTGGSTTYEKVNVGTLKVRTGDGPLRLVCQSSASAGTPLLNIRSVELVPSAP